MENNIKSSSGKFEASKLELVQIIASEGNAWQTFVWQEPRSTCSGQSSLYKGIHHIIFNVKIFQLEKLKAENNKDSIYFIQEIKKVIKLLQWVFFWKILYHSD